MNIIRFFFQVIVKKFPGEKHLPQLDKTKYLVPQEITMSQFQMILRWAICSSISYFSKYKFFFLSRNKMQLHPNRSMYLLVNERSMLSLSTTIAEVYYEFAQADGYLYVTYASQEVFGDSSWIESFNQWILSCKNDYEDIIMTNMTIRVQRLLFVSFCD